MFNTKTTIRNSFFAISFLVMAGLVVLLFQAYNSMKAARAEYANQERRRLQMEQEIAAIKRSLERYRKERDEFSSYLFMDRDIPAFLDEISKNAKEDQVRLLNMKTQPFAQVRVREEVMGEEWQKKRKKNVDQEKAKIENLHNILTLSAMPINIRVQGRFESLVKFLDRLQDYKQLLNVSNVVIRTISEYPLLDCSFTLSIYSLKTIAELQK